MEVTEPSTLLASGLHLFVPGKVRNSLRLRRIPAKCPTDHLSLRAEAASHREMETEVKLKNGSGTGYGLGLQVGYVAGHRVVRHGGEVSGFLAQNLVFPDDRLAVVVLTNQDASSAASTIARQIAALMLTPANPDAVGKGNMRRIFLDLQQGNIDRSLLDLGHER